MGNLINLPNITPEVMIGETGSTTEKKVTSTFDVKNYLDVRLEKGQTSKKLTIRLLPMDLETGNPFAKVHVHNVKVPREIAESGYKSYLCNSKTEDIDHEKYGNKCPFCELNRSAYQDSLNETDEVKKKMLQDLSIANKSKEAVVVRCIERGKEDEGVKFWKFNLRSDKTDPYNQILNLYNMRLEEGKNAGVLMNILDIYNGVDLTITITDGNAAPTVTDGRIQCPVSKDEELMKSWIYDSKRWQDVFTPKYYEYLSLISEGKVPYFDKKHNIWIDKEEYESLRKEKEMSDESRIKSAEAAITGGTIQMTNQVVQQPVYGTGLPNSMYVDLSDLPE